MGVTGLWTVIQPCARPTPLPTLNRKRLAVDASIWIYQFLKAVRDKEGNALRNSHVVGFFRRICKLLFHGIKPVFVFDGGAPVLKRQTVLARKRRREGRREDAARTAGKLLSVQMRRKAEEDAEERKRRERDNQDRGGRAVPDVDVEEVPEILAYVDEIGMTAQEKQATRKFHKKDAYHLPELTNGIEGMGRPEDPRIMSAEELEEYARQFHNGEDVNLYDFSKIDFNGDFFMSLPAGDRYNILNAARLRSRLRMGLSKQQLEEMFPDRMAFSKFQIERVRERNELTQRLMNLNGMNGEDKMFGVNGTGRIAGERGREYVLVKNDGVEGGWALGVVSTEKGIGERNKPIDVDELDEKKRVNLATDSEEDDEFEDVPVEGLNRLPKPKTYGVNMTYGDFQAREVEERRREVYNSRKGPISKARALPREDADSLFVDDNQTGAGPVNPNMDDDDDDLNRAIALSLQQDGDQDAELNEEEHVNRAIELSLKQGRGEESDTDDEIFEDVPVPEYQQKAAEPAKPLTNSSGKMIAHIVNNRANAAVPKRKQVQEKDGSDSDSDMDFQAALAKARKQKAPEKKRQPAPVSENKRNPFDGPLPFERLEFKASLFGKKKQAPKPVEENQQNGEDQDELAGGFEAEGDEEKAKPLPPWLAGNDDIRSQVQEQRRKDQEMNAEDRDRATEDERIFQRDHGVIELRSDDDDSDVEILDKPPTPKATVESMDDLAEVVRVEPPQSDTPDVRRLSLQPGELGVPEKGHDSDQEVEWSESDHEDFVRNNITAGKPKEPAGGRIQENPSKSKSPSPMFEDVAIPEATEPLTEKSPSIIFEDVAMPEVDRPAAAKSPTPIFENANMPSRASGFPAGQSGLSEAELEESYNRQQAQEIADEFDFSDPDDEELLTQLAMEAEEHARFASTLNNKSEKENQEAYEKELKALRNQQKKDRRDADEVSHIMITECQALLRLFGLPYITAPMEAEAQCAELVRLGLVDGVVTDDSDIFLFGGTRVYKNLFNSNKLVECYVASDLEKELSLSRDQLIAIAHLLGSDYTEGLPGIGPVTALEIISEFPDPKTGLEEFRDWWASVQHHPSTISSETSLFRKKFRRSQAAKLFLPPGFPSPAVTEAYMKPDVDSTSEPFQWGVPDLGALRDFLMATIGWSQERTDEVLVPVIRDMNRREQEGTQSNITRFFEGAVGVGANANDGMGRGAGSKRMREAVGKLKAKKGALQGTFADEAADWARKNDLSFTEKEREKVEKKRGGKGKGRKRSARAVEEVDGEEEDEAEAEDNEEADEESDEVIVSSNGKGRGTPKSRGQPAKRKKTKA
ncbi:DNA repair protein rad2 [Clarireedia jacksonii]